MYIFHIDHIHNITLPIYESLLAASFIQPKCNVKYSYSKVWVSDCSGQEQVSQVMVTVNQNPKLSRSYTQFSPKMIKL